MGLTLREKLAEKRAEERGDLRLVPKPDRRIGVVRITEPSSAAVARAAEIIRSKPARLERVVLVDRTPSPFTPTQWSRLAWAIDHEGTGKGLDFDTGFKACLRALGVSEEDIRVLFEVPS